MTKDQIITEDYAIYESDCMYVTSGLPAHSIDLSVYSPPFAGLYNYSSSPNDFSNCETKEQFLEQYEFLIKEISRITKPGRISAVHCEEIVNQNGSNWDFPHEIIKLYEKHGFYYKNRITIWKEPLKVRMRTMVRSLMHKLIVEDSTECFTAMPDYILIFKKKGINEIPVVHPKGLSYYAGATPMLPDMEKKYGNFEALQRKYKDWEDPKTNKLSHIIWQRYASSVWDDIRIDNVLPYKKSKEEDDEKHVHPLQLDVIDRLVELYSNKGETVFTPFMGVGSEVYSPVSLGRKAIGIELKTSYFKQTVKNMQNVKERFAEEYIPTLFDELEEEI
ncbi:DNA modification methylase [Parabacteroides sp. PF5-5]|uniref:DNA-methyltransferase n=1 Tax=unclassified Parabacteroides TaxID=2649774 RepID=UPI0024764B65|nr:MULTISPECIES: DNA methyltransferase [unclassified Parabacteroides]MDH6304635.1 DNA modification methylase [Parabacteroides sp. PH5-39]MDH6315751.1 DNA modification methylase [Parabacteroides sp. PF5-13]MDH6319411.1 DNA modification methylase [Parabacteroides sp. PH5-13]MDH6323142.1 DNA modification methylase [Parabacteroides sp. PH5-8]MDH6326944.1 DNA modification methylase [Parabacteroides sp. PH5-41]